LEKDDETRFRDPWNELSRRVKKMEKDNVSPKYKDRKTLKIAFPDE